MKVIKISGSHLGKAGLLGIAVAAAMGVFVLALVARLLIGPVSLGPFSGELRTSLDRVLPGLAVRFDDAAIEWSGEEGRLNLVILGARVFDENQRIIAQAPEAEIGLALGPFLKGRIEVRRIALVGVQLTLVHSKDGVLRLGIEDERGQSDILQRIRDAIAKNNNGTSSLDSFAVNKARLAFYEEETGVFLVSPNADLQVTTAKGPSGSHVVKATVDANIEISGKPARVEAVLHLPAKGDDVSGDVSISGLDLKSLAANSKFFVFLAPFDLRADLSGAFTLAHGTELRSADFGVGAQGTVNGLGKPLHVRSFKIAGRYDGATGRLLIDDATLEGVQARAHMEGAGDLSFDRHGAFVKAAMELKLDKFAVDMPGVMGHAVRLARAVLRGSYFPATRMIEVDQALVFGGPLSAKFTGRIVTAGDRSPEIDLDGDVAALAVRELLRFWPLQAAPGARVWIDANVSAGRIGPILVHTHIPVGALDQPALPDNAMSVTFPVMGATMSYLHGLTPLSGVNGTGTLTGDTFKADVDSGSVGPLNVSGGHLVISNLHLHGPPGIISAHVDGTVPQVLALIDEKPLHYPSRFQIRTASAKGSASVDLSVRLPMLRNLSINDVGISVRAATSNFGLALNDHLAITNGNVNFAVDNTNLRAVGTVSLGSANLAVDWAEEFRPKGPFSTRLKVNGTLPQPAREDLGIDTDDYLSGPVGVSGELDGYRGKIEQAQLNLDLTSAAIALRLMGYRKAAGTPAQSQANLRMDANGKVRTADFVLSGTALAARGSLRLDAGGDLQAVDVPSFRAGAFNDFALSLTRDSVQGVTVAMSGRSFDGQELLRRDTKAQTANPAAKTNEHDEPFHLSAKFDRVVMREGGTLSPFALNVAGVGSKPRALVLNASLSKTAQLTGSIANAEDGTHLVVAAGDAGLLFKGLFGSTSMRGGRLDLDALIGAAAKGGSPAADYAGKITITDFTVVNQPFLMRLFSAGSFGGLADLMRGKGITIDKLEAPFSLHSRVLTVREVRATGPSLGFTADGYYDMNTNQLALQGAFAPLYGINSVLGALPILGNVLVSKKGEGLIGVTYSASGNADNLNLAVNPLSMLAPGILRRIFQGMPPSLPPTQADSQPPVPAPKPQ